MRTVVSAGAPSADERDGERFAAGIAGDPRGEGGRRSRIPRRAPPRSAASRCRGRSAPTARRRSPPPANGRRDSAGRASRVAPRRRSAPAGLGWPRRTARPVRWSPALRSSNALIEAPIGRALPRAARQRGKLQPRRSAPARCAPASASPRSRRARSARRPARVEIGALRHGARRRARLAGRGGAQALARQGCGFGQDDQRRLAAERLERGERVGGGWMGREPAREGRARRVVGRRRAQRSQRRASPRAVRGAAASAR